MITAVRGGGERRWPRCGYGELIGERCCLARSGVVWRGAALLETDRFFRIDAVRDAIDFAEITKLVRQTLARTTGPEAALEAVPARVGLEFEVAMPQ